MKLFIGALLLPAALLLAVAGVAALTRGWVPPTSRRAVRDTRRYGWGQLVVALALCWQAVFLLLVSDIGVRQWGTLSGSLLLLAGVLVALTGSRRAQAGDSGTGKAGAGKAGAGEARAGGVRAAQR